MIGHREGAASLVGSEGTLRDLVTHWMIDAASPGLAGSASLLPEEELPDEGRAAHPVPLPAGTKWSWAVRRLRPSETFFDPRPPTTRPRAGDVVVVEVGKIGYHASLVVSENQKLRIYPGDLLVGVLGNRYATDAYEAEVGGLEELSLLTAAGMVGTIRSSHRDMAKGTTVSFVGSVVDGSGKPVNLKDRLFRPSATLADTADAGPVLVVVGTGMNAGKTTVVSQTIHSLVRSGLRVAAGKLTGSVSNRDVDEMRSAEASSVHDFSDFGFPSTYLADPAELAQLWRELLRTSARSRPDLTILEIADGVLERETALLLRDPEFRRRVRGVLLAADCPLSALGGVEELRRLGYPVLGVSGALTSAPLYVREFSERSEVPVLSSTGSGTELARRVVETFDLAAPARMGRRSSDGPASVAG